MYRCCVESATPASAIIRHIRSGVTCLRSELRRIAAPDSQSIGHSEPISGRSAATSASSARRVSIPAPVSLSTGTLPTIILYSRRRSSSGRSTGRPAMWVATRMIGDSGARAVMMSSQ
jgi:hypothetical protein